MVGAAVFGAPRFCIFLWKHAVFSRVLAKNRGAPKMAVPTTTHPIPQLTPSDYFCACFKESIWRVFKNNLPREARDLIFKIRSCTVRSDLKIKVFSAMFCLFLRSDLAL